MYTKYEKFSLPELLHEAERSENLLALEVEKKMIDPAVYEDLLGDLNSQVSDLADAVGRLKGFCSAAARLSELEDLVNGLKEIIDEAP